MSTCITWPDGNLISWPDGTIIRFGFPEMATSVCPVVQQISRTYSQRNHTEERRYMIKNAATAAEAEGAIVLQTPGSSDDMLRRGWRISQLFDKCGVWEATVEYSTAVDLTQDIGDFTLSGRTGGEKARFTHAKQHVRSYAVGNDDAPDHNGAINVTKDDVEGVEAGVPAFTFSATKTFAPGTITYPYIGTLSQAAWTVNKYWWHGFAPGEVLLEDANFSLAQDKETITFDFSVSKTVRNQVYGGIEVAYKEGWHYLWFEYREDVDANGRHVRTAIAAHIEQIYDYFDFALLGI